MASSIDQIAASTSFNGISLLDANGTVTLQVGSGTVAGVDAMDVPTVDVTAALTKNNILQQVGAF